MASGGGWRIERRAVLEVLDAVGGRRRTDGHPRIADFNTVTMKASAISRQPEARPALVFGAPAFLNRY